MHICKNGTSTEDVSDVGGVSQEKLLTDVCGHSHENRTSLLPTDRKCECGCAQHRRCFHDINFNRYTTCNEVCDEEDERSCQYHDDNVSVLPSMTVCRKSPMHHEQVRCCGSHGVYVCHPLRQDEKLCECVCRKCQLSTSDGNVYWRSPRRGKRILRECHSPVVRTTRCCVLECACCCCCDVKWTKFRDTDTQTDFPEADWLSTTHKTTHSHSKSDKRTGTESQKLMNLGSELEPPITPKKLEAKGGNYKEYYCIQAGVNHKLMEESSDCEAKRNNITESHLGIFRSNSPSSAYQSSTNSSQYSPSAGSWNTLDSPLLQDLHKPELSITPPKRMSDFGTSSRRSTLSATWNEDTSSVMTQLMPSSSGKASPSVTSRTSLATLNIQVNLPSPRRSNASPEVSGRKSSSKSPSTTHVDFRKWLAIDSVNEITGNKKQINIYDLVVLKETGEIIATDGEKVFLQVFDKLKKQSTFRTPTWPRHGRGITVNPDGKSVAVCHLTEVCIYSRAGDLLNRFQNDKFTWCWGIACNKKGNYVISDSKRGDIYITTSEGNVIKEIRGHTDPQSRWSVSQPLKKRSSLAEGFRKCKGFIQNVARPSTSGGSRKQEPTQGASPNATNTTTAKLISPRYIAVNSSDEILVIDTTQKCLMCITNDATVAFMIGSIGTGCENCMQSRSRAPSPSELDKTLRTDNVKVERDAKSRRRLYQLKRNSSIAKITFAFTGLISKNKEMSRRKTEGESGMSTIDENRFTPERASFDRGSSCEDDVFATDEMLEPLNNVERISPNITKLGSVGTSAGTLQEQDEKLDQLDRDCTRSEVRGDKAGDSNELNIPVSLSTDNDLSVTEAPRTPKREPPSLSSDMRSVSTEQSENTCPICSVADPRGICVDDKDNIIIADKERHCVSLFSRDGRFIRRLLTQKDGIFEARLVSVVSTTSLAVVDGSNTIKVFSFK